MHYNFVISWVLPKIYACYDVRTEGTIFLLYLARGMEVYKRCLEGFFFVCLERGHGSQA